MYHLGYQFGELVYMLDAFEDYEEDLFQKQFNPLFSFFGIEENNAHQNTLAKDLKSKAGILLAETSRIILEKQESISQQLQGFPLPKEIIEEYSVRLFSNVTLKLQKERKVPLSVKESALSAWNNFITKAVQQTAWAISNVRYANYYLVSLIIFVLPLVVESVSKNDSTEVYKWLAGFTGLLGSIGFVRFIIAKRKKRKARRKKWSFKGRLKIAQRRIRRFYRRMKKRMSSKRPCAADCFTICMEVCFDEMFNACCDSVCQAIEDGKAWPWAVLILIAFGITILAVGLI
jgi:hypothetical protein